jgi:RNA polymerase sigma-70 factor (ECF subfamily)
VPEFESAWLYKIAHNVCLSRRLGALRRGRVEAPADLQELEERLPGRASGDHEELFGLDDALASMPENLRRAILLREWQGMSYAEIAQALGISQPAVETLIFRARRHLAVALGASVERPALRVA